MKKTKTFIAIVAACLLIGSCKKEETPATTTTTTTTPTTVTDIDGNVYNTVTIGKQVWMAENLKVTKYNDGTAIPLVTNGITWGNLTTPGYCWYNNNAATYKNTYGALYNWYTVGTGKLAPKGWHVATDAEWTTLTTYLGGDTVAGGKLKETGTTHWLSPNTGATNSSGFGGLPGGHLSITGTFEWSGYYGDFWCSTGFDTSDAFWRRLVLVDIKVYKGNSSKNFGFSVRCVKD